MCTGKCAKCIGCTLIPLSIICITSNAILFFPGWSTEPSKEPGTQLTPEVTMYLGIVGGGVMVLLPAIQILVAGGKGCCGNRCGMFLSILGAAAVLCGSLFCLTMSVVALHRGPVCQYYDVETNTTASPVPTTNTSLIWGRPFDNSVTEQNNENYLFHPEIWYICEAPPNVVEFNIILFPILIAASSIEAILGAIQLFNGLFGLICGTCRKKGDDYEDMIEDEKKEYKC
ncbi:transmembrane 4 L6 family member 5-like [Lithobates pipiens]